MPLFMGIHTLDGEVDLDELAAVHREAHGLVADATYRVTEHE